MSKTPASWIITKIDNLLRPMENGRNIHQGWSPRCEREPAALNAEWGALKTTAIQAGLFLPQHNKRLPSSLTPRPEIEVQVGDLLITCAGPRIRCGVPCLVRDHVEKLMISGKMYRFRPHEGILPEYLEALLLSPSVQSLIDRIKTGGNESGLNLTQGRFRDLLVPLAPTNEQRRIVSKVKSLSTKIKRAREELSHVPSLIERYKQSVIDATIEPLFPRRKAIPLSDIVDAERGIPYGIVQTGDDLDDGIPTVRAGDIKNFKIQLAGLKKVSPKIESNYKRTRLRGGEVLLSIRGTVGNPAVVAEDLINCNISREVAMIPVLPSIDPEFAKYFLSSSRSKAWLTGHIKGVAQSGINLRDLKNLPFPSCTLQEQKEAVRLIEKALSWISRIADEHDSASRLTERLDQSILETAFQGGLVSQDPNDEPASILLERIQAEHAA